MLTPSPRSRSAGFTLVEMMVTVVILGVVIAAVLPVFTTMIRNSQIRAVSDTLQNGLRMAQTESLRRSRQIVFSLTNSMDPKTSLTAAANGTNWSINTITSLTGETSAFIESANLTSVNKGIAVTGPAAICFSSLGRLAAPSSTGVTGATCTLPTGAATAQTYDIVYTSATTTTRSLRVLVSVGGQVHLCDPAKTLSSTVPEGCP